MIRFFIQTKSILTLMGMVVFCLFFTACGSSSQGTDNGGDQATATSTTSENSSITFNFATRTWQSISGALTVNCAHGDFSTIQKAIDSAADKSTIQVCAGTYNETLTIIDKSLSFEGYGEVIIQGNASDTEPLIQITNSPTDTSDYVGVNTVSFNYFWFTNNANIFVHYAYGNISLNISHSAFSDFDTSADYLNGGIISVVRNHDEEQPALVISDTGFYNNLCRGMFGCLEFHDAAVSIENSTFGNNIAYPGVLLVYGSQLTTTNTTFESNQTDGDSPYDNYDGTYGGTLYVSGDLDYDISSEVNLTTTTFTNNSGDDASAIFIDNASVTAQNCTFSGNSASTTNDDTNGLDLHGTIFLLANYFGVAENSLFSSTSSVWSGNSPYDVVINNNTSGYTFSAGSKTTFTCSHSPGTCQ